MSSLVIVFPKMEDAKRVREILRRHGFDVDAVCTTAAQALSEMNSRGGGVLISGFKLPDMFFAELRECMPQSYEMLLIASSRALSSCEGCGVISLTMPLSPYELADTVRMMQHQVRRRMKAERQKPKYRNAGDQKIIDSAKHLLMERNRMTEAEAHRYLQKNSMDSGSDLVEMARMVLMLLRDEN